MRMTCLLTVLSLDAVSGSMVVNIKQPTTRIGIELTFRKIDGEKFLPFYDHLEHNVYHIADFEKEAHQLREKIEKARAGN